MIQQATCQCALCRADRIVRSLALAITLLLIAITMFATPH